MGRNIAFIYLFVFSFSEPDDDIRKDLINGRCIQGNDLVFMSIEVELLTHRACDRPILKSDWSEGVE